MPSTPIAILISGRGSNFLAIARAVETGEIPAEIALVLSNRPDAPGLTAAEERGLPTATVSEREFPGRAEHEAAVLAELDRAGTEWVCLAGYMRVLSPDFVRRYRNRLLNIHPSLLPAFPGLEAQAQALEHGVKVAGCTVHLVDEGVDSGPIVLQRTVPVRDDDDVEALAARILVEEHRAYPEALQRLLAEEWRLEGRRVIFGRLSQRSV